MKMFAFDSPLMNLLNKISDLMILNVLAFLCCLPIVTAGASLTALHYMALKIVRDEETSISKGFFKSFRGNFKQATVIWLILMVLFAVIIGDFIITWNMTSIFYQILRGVFTVVAALLLFEFAFVFPVLSKFANDTKTTMKNALVISIVQFPKTIVMVLLPVAFIALIWFFPVMVPIVFLFGMSVSAFIAAMMYNKFFVRMEERILAAMPQDTSENGEGEDAPIFTDESRIPQKANQ